jgi:hypothetical protein
MIRKLTVSYTRPLPAIGALADVLEFELGSESIEVALCCTPLITRGLSPDHPPNRLNIALPV